MAGSIQIAYDLWWSVNSSAFNWAMNRLIDRVQNAGARAALVEARDASIVMDVESLPVEERNAIYRAAMNEVVPAALQRLGGAEPFDELARMAAVALQRYGEREVADFEIRLSASRTWRTDSSFFNGVVYFLAQASIDRSLAAQLMRMHAGRSRLLDITSFGGGNERIALALLRDKLVAYVRDVGPAGSVTLAHEDAKARDLAGAAAEVLDR